MAISRSTRGCRPPSPDRGEARSLPRRRAAALAACVHARRRATSRHGARTAPRSRGQLVDGGGTPPYDESIPRREKEPFMAQPPVSSESQEQRVREFVDAYQSLRAEVGKIIVGHTDVVGQIMIGLFAGGHVLLEGVPGLGKTLLIKTLAESLELSFSRIQFTPDLMPGDIIGTNIIVEDAQGRKHFQFQRGPIFGHILLADEVNRATPKTQSALLEGMQEGAVTVSGAAHPLPAPFFVLATQNPIEMEGTYPLPEAQLDRFLFKVRVRYPAIEEQIGRAHV